MKGVTIMFKTKIVFGIDDVDVLDFCRILGKHCLRFKVGELHSTVSSDGTKKHYRVFEVWATNRQNRKLQDDFELMARRNIESRQIKELA